MERARRWRGMLSDYFLIRASALTCPSRCSLPCISGTKRPGAA